MLCRAPCGPNLAQLAQLSCKSCRDFQDSTSSSCSSGSGGSSSRAGGGGEGSTTRNALQRQKNLIIGGCYTAAGLVGGQLPTYVRLVPTAV